MKAITLLGSTGSIGTQTLDIVAEYPEQFRIVGLTAGSNINLLAQQIRAFNPSIVAISNPDQLPELKALITDINPQPILLAGEEGIIEVARYGDSEAVVTGIVGCAGLLPTIAAIEAGKDIALANKETLIAGGPVVNPLIKKHGVKLLPADSEHSAIFQCLTGEQGNAIEKIYLTASGGPFRGWDSKALESVTRSQALKHPNWTMGAKITIDSATLMNKGLEVIEAKWLFDLRPDQIDVIVHPQSIIHSLVQFEDGSMKAQMGLPDMKLPIQYAFTYPDRLKTDYPRFNFLDYPQLTFEQADRENFTNLSLAFLAMEKEGTAACALNAANEISVAAFLKDEIRFLDIARINEQVLHECAYVALPSYQDFVEVDAAARILANSLKN